MRSHILHRCKYIPHIQHICDHTYYIYVHIYHTYYMYVHTPYQTYGRSCLERLLVVRLAQLLQEREFVIDNLLVRIHCIIVMIRWTGLAPWEFECPFPGSQLPRTPPRRATRTAPAACARSSDICRHTHPRQATTAERERERERERKRKKERERGRGIYPLSACVII